MQNATIVKMPNFTSNPSILVPPINVTKSKVPIRIKNNTELDFWRWIFTVWEVFIYPKPIYLINHACMRLRYLQKIEARAGVVTPQRYRLEGTFAWETLPEQGNREGFARLGSVWMRVVMWYFPLRCRCVLQFDLKILWKVVHSFELNLSWSRKGRYVDSLV